MVELNENDRDATRFLWPDNPFDPFSAINVYRFRVVFFGATCSQFLLNLSIKLHLENSSSKYGDDIQNSLYVDNLLYSSPSEFELVEFFNESNLLMRSAGFRLREWISNSDILNKLISEYNKDTSGTNPVSSISSQKVLGMRWNLCDDTLSFDVREIVNHEVPTKRIILRESARVFDPFGLIIPVTIRARILLQDLWKSKLGWDDPVDFNLAKRWASLATDLTTCQYISICRNISLIDGADVYAFCDASSKAYGAVVYVKSHMTDTVQFVIAKARVVPVKAPTLPQLELTAANLAARLISYVCKSLLPNAVICKLHVWTDSQIVLSWLKSSKLNKQFVQNRVNNIKQLIGEAQWHYVQSSENPADLLSRGIKAIELKCSHCWFNGPSWLAKQDTWPDYKKQACQDAGDRNARPDSEARNLAQSSTISPSLNHYTTDCLIGGVMSNILCKADIPISSYVSRFSSYTRMLEVTAYVLRYIKLLKARVDGRILSHSTILSYSEIKEAEIKILQLIQIEYYGDIVDYFSSKIHAMPPLVRQLHLEQTDGLLRCSGRLEHSELRISAKCPILLPSVSPFTELLINYVHHYCFTCWHEPRLECST
jgi:hypothetical protein